MHKYAKRAFILVATVGVLYLGFEFLDLVGDQDQILQMMRDDASGKRVAREMENRNKEAEYNLQQMVSGEIKLSPETQKVLRKEGYSEKDINDSEIKEKILRLSTGLGER